MDLSAQLCCSTCGQRVLNLFHLTLMMDVSLAVALPSLTVSPPSVPSPTSSPALPPRLPGSGLISQQQQAHIQLVGVTRRRSVPLSDGDGGQESIWTHTRSPSHTLREFPVNQHSPFPTLPYLLYPDGGGYMVMLRHPAAPSKCFGTVSAVMTLARFHFHQARKIPRDERFKPELTIAGLEPKLPIVRQQRQLQGPGKQINLSYKRQGPIYLNRGMIASEHSSHTTSMRCGDFCSF